MPLAVVPSFRLASADDSLDNQETLLVLIPVAMKSIINLTRYTPYFLDIRSTSLGTLSYPITLAARLRTC